jgi:cytochrome c nitrite reductase small subunit
MSPSFKKFSLLALVVLALGGLLAGFVAFGPPGLYAYSATPEFCNSCHVMNSRYEAWFHNGAHRRIKCVDCHLPNDTAVNHFMAKMLDGGQEALLFHSGRVSEPIRLSAHGAKVLRENCLRCHTETMARVNEERNCWFCHRSLSHLLTGVRQTQTP